MLSRVEHEKSFINLGPDLSSMGAYANLFLLLDTGSNSQLTI